MVHSSIHEDTNDQGFTSDAQSTHTPWRSIDLQLLEAQLKWVKFIDTKVSTWSTLTLDQRSTETRILSYHLLTSVPVTDWGHGFEIFGRSHISA